MPFGGVVIPRKADEVVVRTKSDGQAGGIVAGTKRKVGDVEVEGGKGGSQEGTVKKRKKEKGAVAAAA